MICRRCHGLMVEELLCDMDDQSSRVQGYRCVNCGEVTESVLLHHRHLKHLPQKVGRQPRRLDVIALGRNS
jgi:hypothetical protein